MNKLVSIFIAFLLLGFFSASIARGQGTKYWVFFKDKPISTLSKKAELMKAAKETISDRAMKRRQKVRAETELIDEHDLPVSEAYLKSIQNMGYEPQVVSKWLNAASFRLDDDGRQRVEQLPFVKEVRGVARAIDKPTPQIAADEPVRLQKRGAFLLDYGQSFAQNDLIHTPDVHDLGITGKGVWIGMLDTGFKHSDHEAFENLDLIAERDFINNDGVTENEGGQDGAGQHNHGTQTLSAIGAFKEGQIIGTAFGATFLLAKTEFLSQEIPQEEDNWVAGMEWLESQGVDIVSSSLGYLNFPNEEFYSTADMDGNTAVTTIAADLAVGRGVVVVNSAGNERTNPNWGTIIAPSDGDSVIAVGAVTSGRNVSSFSSPGPTADGRIKPDVVAMGTGVYLALPSSDRLSSQYGFSNGTSFSCPLTAGVAALVLSAHPDLTPLQVRDALRMTADQANSPDNDFGWGLVDAYNAVLFHGPAFSNTPTASVDINQDIDISIKVASRFGLAPGGVSLRYAISDDNFDDSVVMSPGQEANQFVATIQMPAGSNTALFYFTAISADGDTTRHPVGNDSFRFSNGEVTIDRDFHLAQNFPNPFNPTTTISFNLAADGQVTLAIFNILGQRIRTLIDRQASRAGSHSMDWDGTNDDGELVSAGVYFYMLQTANFIEVKKMIMIR